MVRHLPAGTRARLPGTARVYGRISSPPEWGGYSANVLLGALLESPANTLSQTRRGRLQSPQEFGPQGSMITCLEYVVNGSEDHFLVLGQRSFDR